jgi:small neutral amino acid transporter SnatA (MarC family)
MFRASVLSLAVLLSAPTIWAALGAQTISVQTALMRFLITVPIAAVLLALVRTAGKRNRPRRR